MRYGIAHKILATLLLATTLAVVVTAVIMQWSIHRGFMQFINAIEHDGIPRLVQTLEQEYAATGSWDALRSAPQRWRQLAASAFYRDDVSDVIPASGEAVTHPPGMLPPHIARQFDRRLFLTSAEKRIIIGEGGLQGARLYQISHKGTVIGYLGLFPQQQPSGAAQRNFLRQQYRTLLIAAGIVITLSTLLSLFIARRMVQPLKNLTMATHSLSSGEYHIRVPVVSNDELGRLAADFNALALAMEHNEEARRRWVADISHELRTPLTFLRSQVEAILDGVRQPTSDSIKAIHNEIMRFSRLVDDLYQLSQSDVGAQNYRKNEVTVSAVLDQAVSIISPEFSAKNIALHYETANNITVFGDPERLLQLFGNLLDNSLKYTDPGGELRIKACKDGGRVRIDFQDSSPGVAETELEKLFERLYRVESSRSRATGGAGLGLAICRTIVEAHEGTILAKTSPWGGVWIRVELPCYGGV